MGLTKEKLISRSLWCRCHVASVNDNSHDEFTIHKMINSIEISETDHRGSITAHRYEGAREEHVLLEQGELGSLLRTTLLNINKKWEGQSFQDGENCKTFNGMVVFHIYNGSISGGEG